MSVLELEGKQEPLAGPHRFSWGQTSSTQSSPCCAGRRTPPPQIPLWYHVLHLKTFHASSPFKNHVSCIALDTLMAQSACVLAVVTCPDYTGTSLLGPPLFDTAVNSSPDLIKAYKACTALCDVLRRTGNNTSKAGQRGRRNLGCKVLGVPVGDAENAALRPERRPPSASLLDSGAGSLSVSWRRCCSPGDRLLEPLGFEGSD
ncbi:hypothetical protein CB1_000849013 [Camelus ferus]|nr:hypothetical protein CB1_000849013 [Camelus ferus]